MNLKLENMLNLEPYGFRIDTHVNPVGHEDYQVFRNSKFVHRESTLDRVLLFCTRVMLTELREKAKGKEVILRLRGDDTADSIVCWTKDESGRPTK